MMTSSINATYTFHLLTRDGTLFGYLGHLYTKFNRPTDFPDAPGQPKNLIADQLFMDALPFTIAFYPCISCKTHKKGDWKHYGLPKHNVCTNTNR